MGNVVEYLNVVDEENNIIGKAPRRDCHGNPDLIHQASAIFLINQQGDIYLTKRSMSKDMYPGAWCFSASGHVEAGDTYEDTAVKELYEELKVEGVRLEHISDFRKTTDSESEFIRLFCGIYDGNIEISLDEVAEGRYFSIEEIQSCLASGEMELTPGTEHGLEEFFKQMDILPKDIFSKY